MSFWREHLPLATVVRARRSVRGGGLWEVTDVVQRARGSMHRAEFVGADRVRWPVVWWVLLAAWAQPRSLNMSSTLASTSSAAARAVSNSLVGGAASAGSGTGFGTGSGDSSS